MRYRTAALVACMLACGGRASGGGDEGDANTGDGDTGDGVTDIRECGIESECDPFQGIGSCYEDCGWTDYLPSHRCALEALAAGAPALIDFSDGCEGSCYGSLILLRGDGHSAGAQSYYDEFETRVLTDMRDCVLRDAAFFEQCLSSFDMACLSESAWFEGCTDAESLTCTAMQ